MTMERNRRNSTIKAIMWKSNVPQGAAIMFYKNMNETARTAAYDAWVESGKPEPNMA